LVSIVGCKVKRVVWVKTRVSVAIRRLNESTLKVLVPAVHHHG